MNWINPLIDEYNSWLRSKTLIATDSKTGWVTISTPFIGLFNDLIEIYAQKQGNKIILSDNGETLNNLALTGTRIRKGERQYIAERIFLNYGITLKDNELLVEANEKDFPQKKHNFISAIMELNDLAVLSTNRVTNIFKEDVRSYLDEKGVIYTPDFISKGATGLEFTFDFQIAHKEQEIVLRSFNALNTLNVSSFLFGWEDIKTVREKITKKTVKAIAIINDLDKDIKQEYIDALSAKNTDHILWSQKEDPETLKKLAA
jgi:hypothetical protein